VLEMSALNFMDSTGLRSLLVSEELCSVNSCRLLLGQLSPQVARLLELSGLEGRLPRVSAAGLAAASANVLRTAPRQRCEAGDQTRPPRIRAATARPSLAPLLAGLTVAGAGGVGEPADCPASGPPPARRGPRPPACRSR